MESKIEKTQHVDQEPVRAQPVTSRKRKAIALFFLAPLIGEFLLGNLPITWIWALPMLSLLYGGGALLVRESARRMRLGWPGIVVLALAYAVIEEAFVTQSLFNPNFVGLRLLDYGYIPALGIGAWWTVFVLTIHTIWSISVPIALIESFSPDSEQAPWLGPVGLIFTVMLFLAGAFLLYGTQQQEPFMASSSQLIGAGAAVVILIAASIGIGRSKRLAAPSGKEAPSSLAVGAAAFLLSSGFMALAIVHNAIPAALNVAGKLALLAVLAVLLWNWSNRQGWSGLHRFAAASGLLLTYAWYGFVQPPTTGDTSPVVDLAGNAVFTVGALILWAAIRKRWITHETAPTTGETHRRAVSD